MGGLTRAAGALSVAVVLLAGCEASVPVSGDPAAEAALRAWIADGREGCGELPPYYLVSPKRARKLCRGGAACHRSGSIYVPDRLEGVWVGHRDQMIVHEYLHYLLWCTDQDVDKRHLRDEIWCKKHADQSCLIGRALAYLSD